MVSFANPRRLHWPTVGQPDLGSIGQQAALWPLPGLLHACAWAYLLLTTPAQMTFPEHLYVFQGVDIVTFRGRRRTLCGF